MKFSEQRKSLLSSQARVQVPWIKVTIGAYTFGVFSRKTVRGSMDEKNKQKREFASAYNVTYPNFIQSLEIIKVNGQVNQYTLNITYPITPEDDPNFFEKVFSSVSSTRKIIFSYGDVSMPNFIYKDEEAVITGIQQSFDLNGSRISYVVKAVSSAALMTDGCMTFISDGKPHKPSDKIKQLFRTNKSLQDTFRGMSISDLDKFVDGDDQAVILESKTNISALSYLNYLAGCMKPSGSKRGTGDDIYILTIHDESEYDVSSDNILQYQENIGGVPTQKTKELLGPYFKVKRTSFKKEQSDAYEIDIGFNTSTIVSSFSLEQNENYALYYDYQNQLHQKTYISRIDKDGNWVKEYAPTVEANNKLYRSTAADEVWWNKITNYPVSATIQIQGLLRPATLMQYVRLNVIFPGGHKHISSGLYIITKQQDRIDSHGYKTTLALTKISGDAYSPATQNEK